MIFLNMIKKKSSNVIIFIFDQLNAYERKLNVNTEIK